MVGTETYTVTGPDGGEDEVELPEGLVDTMTEPGEESTRVVTDVVMQAFAQQAHMLAHHGEGDVAENVQEIEEKASELFEERFGVPLEEAIGHEH